MTVKYHLTSADDKERMITYRDITVSKLTTPEVFRHTPFEYETTTEDGTLFTTVEPVTVVTRQYMNEDEMVFTPPLVPASPIAGQ